MARRGGGIFRTTPDPITGATKLTTLSIFLIFLLVVGIVLAIVLPLVLNKKDDKKDDETPSGGGAVSPMSKIPGRLTIAEVAQAPSAGQGIIYFSQDQAAGTVCETCTAQFDINLSYSGGQPTPPASYKTVTAPSTSGVVTFDYSVPTDTGGSTPPTPSPPTQVQIEVTARSQVPGTGKRGAPTTFSKTLQYVA